MEALTQIVVALNTVANFLGRGLAFVGYLPGWLSATLIGIASGIGMLIVFKYTSNQGAIKRARQQIRSGLLAVKLFFDSPGVGFRGQGEALLGAVKLLVLAVVPILVMIVPVTLLLGQLALWYQARPMRIDEEAVVTLKLAGDESASWPEVVVAPTDAVIDTHGPVRILGQREICWNLRARQNGLHRLVFRVDGQPLEKELAIGDGFMPVSLRRPDWEWSDVLLQPREPPFGPGSAVRSIEVQYPTRSSWTSGADTWLYYWFAVSLIAGFCLRKVVGVHL